MSDYANYHLVELTAEQAVEPSAPLELPVPLQHPAQAAANPVSYIQPEPAQAQAEILKVSSKSRAGSVAGAIAGVIRQAKRVEIQAIGAGATNQAIKAVAIARGYTASSGIDIFCIPTFIDITIDGEERTGIKIIVERRDHFR